MWATATFVRQVSIINDEERAGILSAARAVSLNPYQPHPVLAARRLMREPLGALTMGGRHRLFLTWRVDPESGRTVLLTVERPGA